MCCSLSAASSSSSDRIRVRLAGLGAPAWNRARPQSLASSAAWNAAHRQSLSRAATRRGELTPGWVTTSTLNGGISPFGCLGSSATTGRAARLDLHDLVLRVLDAPVVHAHQLGHERLANPVE